MTRTSIVIVLVAAIAAVVKARPSSRTTRRHRPDLDACKKDEEEKNKLVAGAPGRERPASCARQGSGDEIVVVDRGQRAHGQAGTAGGDGPPIDDKAAAAASKEFVNVVEKSRGAIQKCYEQALKKNTGLQAQDHHAASCRRASTAQRRVSELGFSPSLGDVFDNCIKTVASKWALPTNSPAMTFKAQVSLTPS